MKKLIFKILWLIPILILMVTIILLRDPARLFRDKAYEKGIADLLLNHKNVTNVTDVNYDARYLMEYYVDHLKEKKEVVVLGSSRVMFIGSKMFPGKSVFNSGVPSASLEDIFAIYGIYQKKNLIPDILVVGLDPWMLNRKSKMTKWEGIKEYYDYMLQVMSSQAARGNFSFPTLPASKYFQLISPSYLQACMIEIASHHGQIYDPYSREFDYIAANEEYNEGYTLLPDGTMTLSRKHRSRPFEEIRSEIMRDITDEGAQGPLKGFTEIDPVYKKQLEDFLALLKREHVQVVFFLPPYPSLVYDFYVNGSTKFEILSIHEVEKFVDDLAKKYGATIVGSYDAKKLGIKDKEFCDDHHVCSEKSIGKFFKYEHHAS